MATERISRNFTHIILHHLLGKLELEGSVAERLEILDRRETELLEEIKQLKATVKKVKEDRLHFRQKSEEKRYAKFE